MGFGIPLSFGLYRSKINRLMKLFLKVLCGLSILLRGIWLFFPGLLFLALAIFAFWTLPQGRDVIGLCLEGKNLAGLVFFLAAIFWVFVTWYSSRMVAYDHDALFRVKIVGTRIPFGEWLLYHAPRFLAYLVLLVLIVAFAAYDDANEYWKYNKWWIIAGDVALYFLFHFLFQHINTRVRGRHVNPRHTLWLYRTLVIVLISLTCILDIIFWEATRNLNVKRNFTIAVMLIAQLGFLFIVITRRAAADTRIADGVYRPVGTSFWDRFLLPVMGARKVARSRTARQNLITERRAFALFNVFSLVAFVFYFLAIGWLPVARGISPLPFAMLAFGMLLGTANLLSLISYRTKVNWHFVFFLLVFLIGLVTEPHHVRLREHPDLDFHAARQDFKTYLRQWMSDSSRSRELNSSATSEYPVFVVLADGGASRSGYWTALVLSHLDSSTAQGAHPFRDHLLCLSGASGGSVGNGVYFAALARGIPGSRIKAATIEFLGADFLSFTLSRMLGPDLVASVFYRIFGGDRAAALEQSIERSDANAMLDSAAGKGFSSYLPGAADRSLPILCINTTRMQDGQPGFISNVRFDSIRTQRIDVLDTLPKGRDIRLSTCMVLGARFPYVSPAGEINNQYFVDGGYFDNSGAGIAHEMLQEIYKMQRDAATEDPLRKLRFYVVHITNTPYKLTQFDCVHPLTNDLFAPLLTLAGSYATQTDVNDARLSKFMDEWYPSQPSHININLYRDASESFPMNWVISARLRRIMKSRVDSMPNLEAIIQGLNGDGLHLLDKASKE